jgi:hypothetical protein
LVWGDVDLLPNTSVAAAYYIEASADGTNWGNPEAVVTAIQSRLQDGSLAVVTSYQNREAPIRLRVSSSTYDGLAAGEAALVAETRREGYGTLTYTPSVAHAEPTVFDVVYAVLRHELDDLDDTVRKERRFVATLTCLPFPRSDAEVVATAPAPPPATEDDELVDACSATTGWTGGWQINPYGAAGSATPTISSGAVKVEVGSIASNTNVSVWAQRTGTIDTSTRPYVYVDYKTAAAAIFGSPPIHTVFPMRFLLDGVAVTPRLTVAMAGGYTRAYLEDAGPSISTVRVEQGVFTGFATSSTVDIWIDQVHTTDTLPASGTRRQLTRTLEVAGTTRTQGRLAIEHETSSLGLVLAYVYAGGGSGYSPPLRPFYASGGTVTTDSALISGGRNMLDTQVVYDVPAAGLVRGNHRVMAALRGSSGGTVTLNLTVETRVGSNNLPGGLAWSATVTLTTGWQVFDLGPASLPSTLLADTSAATVRVTIVDADTSGIDVDIDEAWLFNLDIGTLTHVDCGTGTPAAGSHSNRLWLDPATVTNNGQDAIYRGYAADRSDAFNPASNIKGWTPPLFEPPSMNVFTVTTNALDAAVTLRHFPRWLHNARAV